MLNIAITFDYELFMGSNKLPEKQMLIDPAQKVSDMLLRNRVKATFFADVCSAMKYRMEGNIVFPDLFDRQIQEFGKAGHDIQLHIHPHWMKASSIGQSVIFPPESYRLYNWIQSEGADSVKELIQESKEYLVSVMKKVVVDYKCVAFRAGGYCIQPESELSSLLYNAGIRIDSSVAPGESKLDPNCYYDYRNYPENQNMFFSDRSSFDRQEKSAIDCGIFEVPIGVYSKNPYAIIAKVMKKRHPLPVISTGSFMKIEQRAESDEKRTFSSKAYNLLHSSFSLSYDTNNAETMTYIISRLTKELSCRKDEIYLSCISHPKSLTDEHICEFEKAIQKIQKNPNIRFVTMKEIAQMKNLI